MNELDRLFWQKVKKTKRCWEWQAYVNPDGYGKVKRNCKTKMAHRVSYELSKGKIPNGLQLDHLCRNRKCVNPDHLEPVTALENCRRGNKFYECCPCGRDYDKRYRSKNGRVDFRYCSSCHKKRTLKWARSKSRELRRKRLLAGLPETTENRYKKTCPEGHEYDYFYKEKGNGIVHRLCRKCRAAYHKNRKANST